MTNKSFFAIVKEYKSINKNIKKEKENRMPDHLKHVPESKEFQQYLNQFVKDKQRAHRMKRFQNIISSFFSPVAE